MLIIQNFGLVVFAIDQAEQLCFNFVLNTTHGICPELSFSVVISKI